MRQQRLTTKLPITIVFFWFKNCIPLHFFNSNTRAITHISLPFIHEKCSYRVSSFDEKLFTILHLHQVRPNKSDNDDDNTHKDSCWRAHTHTLSTSTAGSNTLRCIFVSTSVILHKIKFVVAAILTDILEFEVLHTSTHKQLSIPRFYLPIASKPASMSPENSFFIAFSKSCPVRR